MELAGLLFSQSLLMFGLMIISVLLYKKHKISMQGSKDLGSILLYVVIPIVIVNSFCVEKTPERIEGLWISFLLSALSLVLAMVISYVIFGRRRPLDNFASAFSNAGFIGIPLVQAAIGEEAVFYIASYIVLLNLLQWTYGLFVMSGRSDTIRLSTLIKNPIVIATVIALICFFLEVPIPKLGTDFMRTVAGLNTPLAMVISGVYLAQVAPLDMIKDRYLWLCAGVRLLLIPFVNLLLFLLLPSMDTSITLAILIAAAAPTGANIAIFASLYQADYIYSVKTICFTTLLSIVTLPPLIMLAQVWM